MKSIQKIETYIEGMTAGQFKKNELVIDAVIRNLEVIGEASKSISISTKRLYPDIPWDQMNEIGYFFCYVAGSDNGG